MDALCGPVLWLTVERSSVDRRACRDYTIFAEDGTKLGTARAFPWRREIPLQFVTALDIHALVLRRRRSFPFTGKVDVFEQPGLERIGVLSRSGRYRDGRGRPAGAFRDARSLGSRAKESLFQAVMEALLSGDGTASTPSGPAGFIHVIADKPAGTLSRAPIPFLSKPEESARNPLRKFLPRRLGNALFDRAPRGWKLEMRDPVESDARLRLAAALFAIELSHW